ncbi:WAT1-related protein At5g64700-like isoform X1 [Carex rostrata]
MCEGKNEGWLESWKPAIYMVLVQIFTTGMILLSKVVISDGMFVFALLTHRSLFGALIILPFALFFEGDAWKKLELKSCCWISLNAILGYAIPMGLYYYGLYDTTSSYSVIFLNIIPIATYILALIFRMEKLGLCSLLGNMRILGTLGCFGGTFLVTLYKGKVFHWHAIIREHQEVVHKSVSNENQLRGTLLLVGSCFAFACWYLLQSKVLKVYPYKYWSSMMTCLLGGIQTGVVGIILKRDLKSWHLGYDLQLLTIIYSGAFSTAAKYSLNSYAVEKRGASYPPMFNALSLIFTTFLAFLFLGDDLTIGSILGTIVIIGGLYLFLWGKSQDVRHGNIRKSRSDNTIEDRAAV